MKHKFSEKQVEMPNNDNDVIVVLPTGERITLQYRVEYMSLDIIFPKENGSNCTVWSDSDMTPAKLDKRGDGKVGQIVVNL